jgi:hypothetical protein
MVGRRLIAASTIQNLAQTRRMGIQNPRAELPKAPRFSPYRDGHSQLSGDPSEELLNYHKSESASADG